MVDDVLEAPQQHAEEEGSCYQAEICAKPTPLQQSSGVGAWCCNETGAVSQIMIPDR